MARKPVTAEANGTTENRISVHLDAPSTMKPEIVTFTVVGISPLVQNNPVEFIGKTDDGALAGKKVYVDQEEAKLRLYPGEDDTFGHPCIAFKRAMMRAVTGKKFGKVAAKSIIISGVQVVEMLATILDASGKPATKYTIDRRSVVNPHNKARILRCRPSWMPWKLRLALEVDTALVSIQNVRQALELAGRIAGVGDNRPEKGGDNGRFRVE